MLGGGFIEGLFTKAWVEVQKPRGTNKSRSCSNPRRKVRGESSSPGQGLLRASLALGRRMRHFGKEGAGE